MLAAVFATSMSVPPYALAQTDMNALMGGNVVTLADAGGEYALALPVAGPVQRLRTRKGADVMLRISSNKAEELHLHGYDIKLKLKPGEPGAMTLKATRSGRFELETHNGHRTVLILEVMP